MTGGMRAVRDGRSTAWSSLVAVPPALLALVVTLPGIGKNELGNDEYATWYASTLSFPDLFRLLDDVDALLGGFYLVMHPWLALAGENAGHMRAPSAAAMACAAGLLALIGRRLFDPWTGLAAGLMLVAVPSISAYGQEARPYAFAVASTLLATLLLLRAIEVPSWPRWSLYGGALVLIALTHVVSLTVLAAHAGLVWWDTRAGRPGRGRRWLVSVAVPLAVLVPLMVKGSTQMGAIAWTEADGEAVRELPERMFGSANVALLVIALGLVAAVAMARVDRRSTILLLSWAVIPPVFCYVTFPLLHLFLYRYVLFTVPAWVLLAAALPSVLARVVPRQWPAAVGGLVLAVAVGLVGLPDQEEARRTALHEPSFGAAARVVQARLEDGDGIVYAVTRRNSRRAFAYLHATGVVGEPEDVLLGKPASEIGKFAATECVDTARCLAGTNRIWLLTDAEPGPVRVTPVSARAMAMLEAQFDRQFVRTVRQMRVHLLVRDSSGPTTR